MSDLDAVADVLSERPDLEDPLEAVLAVDENRETWTFDDVPIESGPFGELVGRGVVESVGDEYRLADPEAVRGALSGDRAPEPARSASTGPTFSTGVLPTVDRTTAALIAGAIAFVGLVRAHPVASIYRDGDVVLSGNDPYFYRYWIERAVADGGVPDRMADGEPLLVATMATLADLLGGTASAVGHVVAWYPVVSAVISAAAVYLIAVRTTGDRRVGVAAVLFLALIPGHALRTSVGYADHHAFDYVWLGATAVAVTWLATVDHEDLREWRTWGLTGFLGVAVAGQVLAWDAGPLLVAPIGAIVAGRAASDVRRGTSPVPAGIPPVAGLAIGSVIALTVHVVLGFQSTVVALAPAVIGTGSAGTVAVALVAHRLAWGLRRLLTAYAALVIGGTIVLVVVPTPLWDVFVRRLDTLFRGDAIAETQSLFSPDSFGFLLLFGFALLLALPAMADGLRRSLDDGRWLVVTTYAWYFLLLAAIQVRFVGELATFTAVFAGVGFVWAAEWIDAIPDGDGVPDGLAPLRIPNRRVVATLFALMVLFGSFGALQVGVKTSQVVIDDDAYRSATVIEDHAQQRGQTYPENYVLSDWGRNRVYNYFVNGESASYGYARTNYGEFAGGTDPDSWYGQFEGRVGYVVLAMPDDRANPSSTVRRLTENFGSGDDGVAGVGHYRALYVPPGGSRVVVEVVPGANLSGTATPGSDVTVSTVVDRPNLEFAYERHTRADENGDWQVRVANPGTYDVSAGNRTTTVDVSERAVLEGANVSAD